MTAPEEFSRNRNTVSGDTAAATTDRKPTTVEVRMAHIGTPLRLIRRSNGGASVRSDSTNNMRDAVYSPELRQESTAVRTTKFIRSAANPICIASIAET